MPKYIVNEMPDMEGKGKRRVYPKLEAYRRLNNDELVKEVHSYHRAVSESVIGGVAKVMKTPFSREERIKNALEVIDRNGFIKLREYAEINKLNPTYASDDLKEICGDPDAPITSRGSGSHKVWVKK